MLQIAAPGQSDFDGLLGWLDADRERAGEKYEKIRRSLIRIFASRGCFEPEELADETFNRVVRKVSELSGKFEGEPAVYCFGVGKNVHREWLRRQKKKEIGASRAELFVAFKEEDAEAEIECLKECLDELPPSKRGLIIDYYSHERGVEKIEARRRLAEKLGITLNALQAQASRIRRRLQKCVSNCAAGK